MLDSEISSLVASGLSARAISDTQKQSFRLETITDRYNRLNSLIFNKFNGVVQAGPFAGMAIQENSTWKYSHVGQMILGIYEQCVQEVLFDDTLIGRRTFVDIGAADGYYPIGLCFSGRMDIAYAFEQNATSQNRIKELASLNGQSNKVVVRGAASPSDLQNLRHKVALDDTIILIDVEGYEFELLTEEVVAALNSAVFIIEIHNWIDDFENKIKNLINLASRYCNLRFISTRKIDLCHLELVDDWPDDNRYIILSEGRPCKMSFLLLTPKLDLN